MNKYFLLFTICILRFTVSNAQQVQWTTTTANGDSVRPVKSTQGLLLPFVKPSTTSGQFGWLDRMNGTVATSTSTDTLQGNYLRAGSGGSHLLIGSNFLSALGVGTITFFDSFDLTNNVITNIGHANTDFTSGGGLNLAGRLETGKGSNIASNDTLTLGTDGNYFIITGTDSLKWITITNWQAGAEIILEFQSTPVLVHNAASPPVNTTGLRLAGSANKTTTTGMVIRFHYNGTVWRQSAPTVEF